MNIVIIGGHGKVAQLVTPLLTEAGHTVTSAVRNPDHVADVEGLGATAEVADVEHMDLEQITDLLLGHDAVIWAAGAGGGNPERTRAVDRDAAVRTIDAAAAADVDRFVMVSYVTAGRDDVPEDNPFHHYARAKAEADDHLRASSLNWTILAPGQLTEEDASLHVEVGPHVTSGETSRANVAHMAALVVGRRDLAGLFVPFRDGPIAIPEALQLLSRQAAGDQRAPLREGTEPLH